MSEIKRVLIVGSGIGGATAAHAIQRLGMEAHCIDINPKVLSVGAGICLLHNAGRALAAVGLAEPCFESGFRFEVVRQFDSAGNLLASNAAPPAFGIRRPELARILTSQAIAGGAVLEYGVTVSDIQQHTDQVDVTLSDGRELTYDLVVAADGAYSPLRDKVFGSEFAARFAGQGGWRFNVPRPAQVDSFSLYRTPDGKGVGALPTSAETCYFFYVENFEDRVRLPDDRLHEMIHERLAPYSAPAIREALALVTEPGHVTYRHFDITLVPAPWHRGRVVLIGDAAHSPTPQMTSGGGLAIEDAVVLAECLAHEGSAQEVLATYSQRRYERVKTVWNTSLQISRFEREDPLANREKTLALLLETYQFLGQPY